MVVPAQVIYSTIQRGNEVIRILNRHTIGVIKINVLSKNSLPLRH
jgi:hypothetical protein